MEPEQDETHVDSKAQAVPSVVIQIWQFTVESKLHLSLKLN